jgi:nucleotide-binding universal stress UspA family protein
MEFKKILIGIDDSKYSENAAQYGFELAHKFKASVGLVHIVEPIPATPINDTSMMGTFIPSLSTSVDDVEMVNVQEQYSQKLMDSTIERYGKGLVVSQYNEFGATADSIINCAAEFGADLIVIGTHSRTGFDRFLMGSIAEDVVRHSPVAVLVIPMKEEEKA